MRLPETFKEYEEVSKYISNTKPADCYSLTRTLARMDLYFLLRFACGRSDIEHPWLLARCKEVQNDPNGHLDLWSRDHYKSTIITFAKTLQDILASHGDNPLPEWNGMQPTFGIFSHTRGISKGFLRQIKRECESNTFLKAFFGDILWENPFNDAPKWSEDDGLIFRRKNNPKEATVEAWGLVEGQPTGKHFDVQIYDDVVTLESVQSPGMTQKTLTGWEMSINLGSGNAKRRYIGTRYSANDTYREIIKRQAAKPRLYPGTHDGTPNGDPVFRSKEWLEERRTSLGPYTFSTQILQNPVADQLQTLKKEWINYHDGDTGDHCNRYMIIDPASEKKKTSDYTSAFVIGLAPDQNYRVLDMVRDRLNLIERGDLIFKLHRKWNPINTGYEKYGLQADIEYFKDRMKRENYYFDIIELGGQMPKLDRIKRLIPSLAAGRWYLPHSLFRTNYEGKTMDLVETYIHEEYLAFPVPVHDDMLDAQSRIIDVEMNAIFPRAKYADEHDRYKRKRRSSGTSVWAT